MCAKLFLRVTFLFGNKQLVVTGQKLKFDLKRPIVLSTVTSQFIFLLLYLFDT